MNKKLLCIVILLLIGTDYLFAGSPTDTTYKVLKDTFLLRSRIVDYSKNLQTIECNFIQKKFLSVLTEPNKSTGYFCFKDPSMVRWEYNEPFKYLIIIKDNRLTVFDDNKTKSYNTISSKSFIALNSNLGKILHGSIFENNTDFSCKYFENLESYKLILVPRIKGLKSYFSSIILYFDKKLFSVSKVTMMEKNGDVTDIEFINRKINQGISDERFTK